MRAFASLPTRTVTLRRMLAETQACPGCSGSKMVSDSACPACKGAGVILDDKGKPEPLYAEMTLDLRPWPIGYPEMLSHVFPPPVEFVNGKPTPDPKKAEHHASRLLILLARCLGSELSAKAPANDAESVAWAKYAAEVKTELADANLVEGDVSLLFNEMGVVNQGHSRPKA